MFDHHGDGPHLIQFASGALTSGAFYNTKMTDYGMRFLENWIQVRYLFFNGGSFTDKGLVHLTNLPELESLYILGDEIGIFSITDQGLTHVGKMANLKKLCLRGIPIPHEIITPECVGR